MMPTSPAMPARFGRKVPVETRQAMVVTSHPLATAAAVAVLQDGGNACDAALTAAATQLVVEPHMTAITGGLSLLFRDGATGSAGYVNGNVNAPLAPLPGFSGRDLNTGRGVPVPGWWGGFNAASQRWGRLPRARLLEPAISAAREGFEMNPYLYGIVYGHLENLGVHEQGREVFWRDGELIVPGQTVRQTRMARTLERLRDEGDSYWLGDFAAAFSKEAQRGGGVITPEDFAAYAPLIQRPVTGRYREFDLLASPPPDDGGMQLIEALNILELVDLRKGGPAAVDFDTLKHLIRVHNEVYYAAPRQGDLDTAPREIELLLSKEYAARRFDLMAMDEPRATGRVVPTPGTIHISVVDAGRNVASCTHSHMASAWTNGLFAEGFQLSGGGSFFQRILPQPGARATVYLAPTIVLRGGHPVIAAGSPSVSLVACILQNLVNMMDFGMSVEQSVHQPRFGTRPHTPERGWEPGTTLEADFAPAMRDSFLDWTAERRLWSKLIHPRSVLTGNFEGIAIDPATGVLSSCADPRRVGAAAGY
jgi:gamma-glutamyltranspeptidase/glutathione hydrolase